jgi:hypothetical protein
MPFPLTFPLAFSLRLRSEDEGNLAKNLFLPLLNFPLENKAYFIPYADRKQKKEFISLHALSSTTTSTTTSTSISRRIDRMI